MEPGARAAEALTPETRGRTRVRLAAGCVLLVGLAFIQSPGYLVADTKFDLAVDPVGFLSRALHLWDEAGAFGQLQNQAYGYLWPMGPFFVLGDLVGLPGWVVQRSWMALLLCVAFVGSALLCRALGVRSDLAALIAAFAYATSPRIVSIVGSISIEAWPSALAPWVLLPLVVGSTRGSPRRMAMLSGLAVAMVGGVNAAATFAVLPLGILWLLTRSPGPRRRRLMLWWPLFTALGTLWWLVPLFVMGTYSPPFLDYIESASVTTVPTTMFDALRGTSAWVPYIEPGWQGGYQAITQGYIALNSGVVLMLGITGLVLRDNPHRLFLGLSVLVGLLLVSLGHQGQVQGWLAEPTNELLDGVLAPIRNVHKFDPVIRLPLVVGLAWLVESMVRRGAPSTVQIGGRTVRLSVRHTAIALATLGVVVAAAPAVAGRLAPTDPVLDTPDYWREAATWLDENAGEDVALLAPGSAFAEYLWGSPRDEPVQYLPSSRWAVRNAVPLTPAGNIRMLDAVEARLAQGHASPGLASYLTRAGVHYVVVRNDLEPGGDIPDPVLVHQALEGSPGLRLVKSFGPELAGEAHLETDEGRLLVNGGWLEKRRVIEVYAVTGSVDRAVGTSRLPVVVGGPEDLIDLADVGILAESPTRLATDVPDGERPSGPVVLTDGLLERERFFGRVHDGYSSATTPGDRRNSGNPTPDYLPEGAEGWQTVARLIGVRAVSASSSRSDSTAIGGARPGNLPFAAMDGFDDTEWAADATDTDSWWKADLEEARRVGSVALTLGRSGPARAGVVVETENGTSGAVRLRPGVRRVIRVPQGQTDWVRVRVASAGEPPLVLAEVAVPGVTARRQLVLPDLPSEWRNPDVVLLRALRDARTGCAEVGDRTPCLQDRFRPSEEPFGFERSLTLPARRSYPMQMITRPMAGDDLYAFLQQDLPLNATGSSVAVPDARASGLAAVDGDPGTSWTPRLDDDQPELALSWLGESTIRGLALAVGQDAPVRRPTRILLTWPGGEREVELSSTGRASLDPITTDRLTLRVLQAENAGTVDAAGFGSPLPPGIGELRLRGLPYERLAFPDEEVAWACGTGPSVTVDGDTHRTRLVAGLAAMYRMEPVTASLCDDASGLSVGGGRTTVSAQASALATPETLTLGELDATITVRGAAITSHTPVLQEIAASDGANYVVVRQNANPGWAAEQGGEALESVVVDGWQQAWRTNGSGDTLVASFEPDAGYRWGLAAGAVFFALLLALALVPRGQWRGERMPALSSRRLPTSLVLGVTVVGMGLLAGFAGVACAVAGALLGLSARRVSGDVIAWAAGSLLLVAAVAYFVRPWGDPAGWAGSLSAPHYLVAVALAAVLAAATEPGPRPLRAMHGRSTNR